MIGLGYRLPVGYLVEKVLFKNHFEELDAVIERIHM